MLFEVVLHGLTQPVGFVGTSEKFRPVTVMKDGGFTAIRDAPLGFCCGERLNALIDHRVIRATPLNAGMTAKQPTDAGIRSHGCSDFIAEQVDHQHIGLGHQGFQRRDHLRPKLFIRIEHQHPIALEVLQSVVAGRGKIPRPFHPFDARPGLFGYGHGGVNGTGVHQHQFIGEPFHGGQAGRQSCFLVAHDHGKAEH